MQAIRVSEFGGPEVLRLEEVEALRPGPGQILLQVEAIGVNPVEAYIRTGTYAVRPPLPYTPGSDAAGLVAAAGEGVSRFRSGDRVYAAGTMSGAYAAFALCSAAQLHPLPERVSFDQGAALGVPYGTAYRALFQRTRIEAGECVFIHGASGGVGLAAVQLSRAAGLTVIGSAGTEEGRELVRREGAHHALDHRAPNYLAELANLTGGRGPDLIVEMLANVNLNKDLEVLAKGGRVVVVGNRGTVEINPRAAMMRDASILAMTLMNATERDLAGAHAAIVAGLENGTLRPVVGRKFPLADATRAHQAILEPGAHGKIVLTP